MSGGSGGSDGRAASSGDIKAVHLLIEGVVQGVGYRYTAQRAGAGMGLVGWVRNRYDGGVEAHAQGPPAAVDAMVDWCREGPAHARVDRVTVEDVAPDPTLSGFGIRP